MSRTLALFDFDGTVTTRDTLFVFARFIAGTNKYKLGLIYLAPWLIAQRLGFISAQKAKEVFLSYFIKGITVEKFNRVCDQFCKEILPAILRPQALKTIEHHKQHGSTITIVSASPEDWITPWANDLGITVVATRLEKNENSITGKIAGLNCNGAEKVNRISEKFHVIDYPIIVAYGDSEGDREMLELATQKFFKPFRDKN
jgi:phosphatidylglycerophosphatase C